MTTRSEGPDGPRAGPGRPPSTSREEVGHIALELFENQGFEQTTMDEIAAAAGIGRRTLFRYYPSKNDIVWGDFDEVLVRLRRELEGGPANEPVDRAIRRAVVASNSYPPEQLDELRIRMTLITTVPALQGHSMLRYREWRRVVSDFITERRGDSPEGLEAEVIGYAALSTAMAAFGVWVEHPDSDHEELIARGFDALGDFRPSSRRRRE